MILRTKTDVFSGNIGIEKSFGTFTDIANSVKSLFQRQSLFDDNDIQMISDYNREVENMINNIGGLSSTTDTQAIKQAAMNKTMEKASDDAKNYVKGLDDLTINLDAATKSSKALEFGMKALAAVGNMVIVWIINSQTRGRSSVHPLQ